MAKETTPEGQVRRWVEGVLSQADEEIAATTLAVLWNGGAVDGTGAGRHGASATLATLLHEPFAELGSPDPELDASLAAHAAMGKLSDLLWQGSPPARSDVEGMTRFCLAAVIGVRAVRGQGGQPVLVDVDDAPGEGELLSMRSVGICSSDLLYLRVGTEHVLGHELAGVRADGTAVAVEGLYGCGTCEHCLDGRINLCPQSTQRALGMMADGGMAEQFRAPSARLVDLPVGLDVSSGALVEPASVSWHGVRVGGVGPDTRVLVVGAGSVGLLAVAAAQAMGAPEVALAARHPHQRAIGEQLGATEPDGLYDLVIEAAGSADAVHQSIEQLAPGGTISVLGVHYAPVEVPFLPMLNKEATLITSMGYCRHAGGRDMAQAAEMLATRPELAEALITHRFPLEDAAEAFRVADRLGHQGRRRGQRPSTASSRRSTARTPDRGR